MCKGPLFFSSFVELFVYGFSTPFCGFRYDIFTNFFVRSTYKRSVGFSNGLGV